MKLPEAFYQNNDVISLSKQVLGKYLFTNISGQLTGGKIVETEAYLGAEDRGSHAYQNRNTARTQILFEKGGYSYVYLCYGIHFLFNLVTGDIGKPNAILIRGIEPVIGLPVMLARRNHLKVSPALTAGPGALAQALGINKSHNAISLSGDVIWLEDIDRFDLSDTEIKTGPRVGMNFEGRWHSAPLRFSILNNKYVSKAK